ncbi:hypothetical protein OH76DRAFT_79224 [Lentinus brumalis]|uniref:Uncharacterized protein n=1 Tax=Lentinus brumalis TaxID=2498619 RepID=A0A371DKX8_9APHY|nr:hypothetical protein OH76DRAFT_79224 [Polyporus brumalis]
MPTDVKYSCNSQIHSSSSPHCFHALRAVLESTAGFASQGISEGHDAKDSEVSDPRLSPLSTQAPRARPCQIGGEVSG